MPRWPADRVLAVAVVSFLASNVVAGLVAVALGLTRAGSTVTPAQIAIVGLAQGAMLAGLAVVLLARFAGVGPSDLGATRRPAIAIAIGVGAGLWILAEAVSRLQQALLGPDTQLQTAIELAHPSLANLAIEIVVDGALIGAAEELFFRAILFALFRQHMSFAGAALLSSVLFAATHGLGSFVPVLLVGLGLAALYERRQSLWTNALAHATFNSITALVIYVFASRAG
jgi:membrane protease YdiL (CAAX protease family)